MNHNDPGAITEAASRPGVGGEGLIVLYAERPIRRGAQVLADLLVVGWTVGWIILARAVHTLVTRLDTPGRLMQRAGDGMTARAEDAANGVSHLPLVGGTLHDVFHRLGGTGRDLADAGYAQASFSDRLALVLALALAVPPILGVLAVWLHRRVRWSRAARAARQLRDADGGVDLLALRALVNRPLPALRRVSADPLAAWRANDAAVTARLAGLELRGLGLRPTTGRAS